MRKIQLVIVLLCLALLVQAKPKKPKRVIFLIGDGMGLAQISGALANYAHKNAFERFSNISFSKTSSSDDYVTDSAAGATAFSIGQKTYNGAIGVDSLGNNAETIFETLKKQTRFKTGVVVTSSVTHATPASFYAHVGSRRSEEDIATFLLNQSCDLAIGGGSKFFTNRKDQRNLADELKLKGFEVHIGNQLFDSKSQKLIELLDSNGLPKIMNGRGSVLKEASMLAIRNLSSDNSSFMLMIEGSQIDWGGHDKDFEYMKSELIDFNETINAVLDFAMKDKNTLVVVTADHETGGLSLLANKTNPKTFVPIYASDKHSGIMVPVFAYGPGAELFSGIYENTAIYYKFKKLLKLK